MKTKMLNSNKRKRAERKIAVSEYTSIKLRNLLNEYGYEVSNEKGHYLQREFISSQEFGILEPQEPEEKKVLGVFKSVRKRPALFIGYYRSSMNGKALMRVFGRSKISQMKDLAKDLTKLLNGRDNNGIDIVLMSEKPYLEQPFRRIVECFGGGHTCKLYERWRH